VHGNIRINEKGLSIELFRPKDNNNNNKQVIKKKLKLVNRARIDSNDESTHDEGNLGYQY
jgi:hypothetical protein